MSFLSRATTMWTRVTAFVEQREDATSLALCRIAVGLTLFVHMLRMLTTGAASFAWQDAAHGGIGTHIDFVLGLVGGTAHTQALTVLCVIAALTTTIGFMTRPSLLLSMVLFRVLCEITNDARSAYDSLLNNAMFLLLLSACGRALSVDVVIDAARGKGAPSATRWPRMLLVLQMGLLYGGSAVMKASSGWVPGGDASALWYILNQPLWARFDSFPLWAYPITQVATTTVWLFELSGPLFVLSVLVREAPPTAWLSRMWLGRVLERVRFRDVYLVVGLAMHLGIELTMEVGAFTGASLALYFCAVRPHEWQRLMCRMRRMRRSDAVAPPATADNS